MPTRESGLGDSEQSGCTGQLESTGWSRRAMQQSLVFLSYNITLPEDFIGIFKIGFEVRPFVMSDATRQKFYNIPGTT